MKNGVDFDLLVPVKGFFSVFFFRVTPCCHLKHSGEEENHKFKTYWHRISSIHQGRDFTTLESENLIEKLNWKSNRLGSSLINSFTTWLIDREQWWKNKSGVDIKCGLLTSEMCNNLIIRWNYFTENNWSLQIVHLSIMCFNNLISQQMTANYATETWARRSKYCKTQLEFNSSQTSYYSEIKFQ